MKGAMPLDKTLPFWDAAPILNIQIKYPLLDKLRFLKMRRTALKAPLREGGQLAQACSKRRGESANTSGLLEQYPNAGD